MRVRFSRRQQADHRYLQAKYELAFIDEDEIDSSIGHVPHRSEGPYRSLNRAFVWSWGNKMQKWIRQEEYMHIQLYVSMLVAFPMKPQDPHLGCLIIALHIVKPSILRWGILKVHSTRGGAK